ncbi:MAG: tRNA uridine-5-carboxymethylaminomethyl(34) synthesis GTPase MnmE [Lentibacter algarum]|jgi:tRNA modification GTPase|uniref:tRNA uridine-5-carboxymethylaminomethyl(34) synthesis GTPase MnmE n=1 Tax=Lentibacter algarum TaxID=576131 RepID=UPI002354E1A3|nr:tRNA uridine-5-carboxymethylaminomethyl(34) synthesis GTPase MnmE [Lentibacter algarum]MCO4776600.1 tRNA uridine-5-carboxymethylaminomethyl(34) synthesis GTPase MnmE [Lentibacter algarum]
MSTIFAQASAAGKAGVAVVRISGPKAFSAASQLCGSLPAPREAALRRLRSAAGEVLDEALVLCFSEKASFTGEETVEFQTHGSVAVVNALLAELGTVDGLRLAEPGEFTRRALANGRLDLAQVEGLADLIASETEAQRQQALRLFSGGLGDLAAHWRERLIRASALLTVTIDFADEEVPVDVSPEVLELIAEVQTAMQAQVDGFGAAERIRTGYEVAIVGPPNVGKSTLLNALAGRDAAITSEIAGTTRDVIEVRMELAGLPVTLLDTAGLRETDDTIEKIGVARALERAKAADLRVFLIESNSKPELDPAPDDIVIASKADLSGDKFGAVSGKTGAGVAQLVEQIGAKLSSKTAKAGLATRARHKEAMERCLVSLAEASNRVALGPEFTDIASEELRISLEALNMLIGRVDIENVLDEVFSSFCLGK